MDPVAFSKMSLRDRSPIVSAVTKNNSLSGPALQNLVMLQGNEQNFKRRPRRRGSRKEQEQNPATRISDTKSTLSISEDEEDGGVSLNAALNSVPAIDLTRSEVTPKSTDVSTSALSTNGSVTSTYMLARNTHIPVTLKGYPATNANQATNAILNVLNDGRQKSRQDSKSANTSGLSNSTLLNPTAPIYQPSNIALPLGVPDGHYGRSAPRFTPYEPVRFSSTAAVQRNTFHTTTTRSAPLAVTGPIPVPALARIQVSASVSTPVSFITSAQKPLTSSSEVKNGTRIRDSEQTLSQRLAQNARNAAPEPEAAYILQASQSPTRISSPHNLLLVLDLNGTLVYRKSPSIYFTPRPFLSHFLEYCMANHSVMIWSSARPKTVKRICNTIFSSSQRQHVVAEWARNTLELSKADFLDKVQVYKRLDRIWDNDIIQKKNPQYAQGGRWSQANTVLIDDSMYKAAKQPYNHLEIPEYLGPAKSKQDDLLGQVVAYLEEARRWDDISRFVKQRTFTANGWQSLNSEKEQSVAPKDESGSLDSNGRPFASQ